VPAGDNVVRLLPPLNVTDEEIRIALDAIRAGAKSLSASAGAA
jgi:acetylornithine/N-succinyldiaminopimelate aminotransferase